VSAVGEPCLVTGDWKKQRKTKRRDAEFTEERGGRAGAEAPATLWGFVLAEATTHKHLRLVEELLEIHNVCGCGKFDE
jgi:hypothetical protein